MAGKPDVRRKRSHETRARAQTRPPEAAPRPLPDHNAATPSGRGLGALARRLVHRRTPVFLLIGLISLVAAVFGAGASGVLSSGGYTASDSESARVEKLLDERFHSGSPHMVLLATGKGSADGPQVAASGAEFTRRVAGLDGVARADSYWTTKDPALRAEDGRAALVLVRLEGDANETTHRAGELAAQLSGIQGDFTVEATGLAVINSQLETQSNQDLTRAELIGAPLTLVILLLAFGSLVAALLPVLVGVVSVVCTLAVLRLLASFTDVSLFAMNVTTALGFGLAVDYSLFLVTRYREELAQGRNVLDAVVRSMRTAGRTVLFSSLTVVISLAALLVFPITFLRSLAYAGIAVVGLAAVSSLLVLPPVLYVIGHRIDRLDVFAGLRRKLPGARGGGRGAWHWLATRVMRRPVLAGTGVAVLLIALALPFGHARFALTDDRILPKGASAQTAADALRTDFAQAGTSPVTLVLPDLPLTDRAAQLPSYLAELSRVEGTARVDGPLGSWAQGRRVAPPGPPSAVFGDARGVWLNITAQAGPNSPAGERHAQRIRAVPAPAPALVGGQAAALVDTKDALGDRIPYAGAVIVLSMLVLLFLFTGSVVVPLQALVLNTLSLTASFGAMVYVFQDGHLKWLVGDFAHTGQLEVTVPVLMFCVAFGLSMDYTVFLLSRIREEYLATGDNSRAVVFGIDHTGRLITAAALVVATVLGALATSQLSLLKLLGAGLALAVLVDATLVRGILVPAVMKLCGRANWWAPQPLRRLHGKVGLRDG
ncbi:membrane protein [Streptomyces spiroverticillatus]|uniref:Membrane protein n=1 Tax=Streptomyces finlayi TaxID=67296 RepID=A0A918WWW1_9ACTN|nr:MMPL family transporter [Streptomyces finlayi]GHA08826.1 membrane protein [Streptomyces spiroverticillatus]GHC91682.1 membrane protein [Streptomyces finlayi]